MSNLNNKVLIIDEEITGREFLKNCFSAKKFDVTTLENYKTVNLISMKNDFDILIVSAHTFCLDLLRAITISKKYNTPIIILTKDDKINKVQLLEAGADDCIGYPFNTLELLARVNNILGRKIKMAKPQLSETEYIFRFGDYVFDTLNRSLSKSNFSVHITTSEFFLLNIFVIHPRIPMSRDKLMKMLKGREYSALDRSLDIQVSRLRRIIEHDPTKPSFIKTIWSVGYVFIPN